MLHANPPQAKPIAESHHPIPVSFAPILLSHHPLPLLASALRSSMSLRSTLTLLMLASLRLTPTLTLLTLAIALLSPMVCTSMIAMAVRLSLHRNSEVLARLTNGMDETLVTIWPLALEVLLLVVFGEGCLGDFVALKEGNLSGFECGLAGGVGAFDLRRLNATNAIIVVVDCGLQNCSR